MFDKNKYTNKEKFLLNLKLGDMFKLESKKRADALNSVESAAKHNVNMIKSAAEELQQPLQDAVTHTREEVSKFAKIPGVLIGGVRGAAKSVASAITTPISAIGSTSISLVSGTTKVATHLITNPIGFALNLPRMGADAFRLAMRPPLIFADYLGNILGRPSAWVKKFREKTVGHIDHAGESIRKTCADIRDRALHAIEGQPRATASGH
ncbi:hypothetical protein HZA40_04280 [Candidatus Peregrinibacteria bacterium]|nr:hypothetical protein [Candidatus Peregrinibacteria bacterium]